MKETNYLIGFYDFHLYCIFLCNSRNSMHSTEGTNSYFKKMKKITFKQQHLTPFELCVKFRSLWQEGLNKNTEKNSNNSIVML